MVLFNKMIHIKNPVFVYGIRLVKTKEMVYVGVSKNPNRRFSYHQRVNRLFRGIRNEIEMLTIESHKDYRTAKQAETKIQTLFKLTGQCRLNFCPSYSLTLDPNLKNLKNHWDHCNVQVQHRNHLKSKDFLKSRDFISKRIKFIKTIKKEKE